MKPITFSCCEVLPVSANEVARQILEVANWLEFKGFAFLPGIKAARFEVRTPDVIGSRIKVTNTDGSSHVEEIVEWQVGSRLKLHMHQFSPPLARLATGFDEAWEFEPRDGKTAVTRSFNLYARSALSWPVLWV